MCVDINKLVTTRIYTQVHRPRGARRRKRRLGAEKEGAEVEGKREALPGDRWVMLRLRLKRKCEEKSKKGDERQR